MVSEVGPALTAPTAPTETDLLATPVSGTLRGWETGRREQ